MGPRSRAGASLRTLIDKTRPVDDETSAALARRWAELPSAVRTRAQLLGRHAVGCEGTHGVFPRCDFGCSPCYHSRDANRVRTDGEHTVHEVTRQLRMLRRVRGPRAHAQLIGGEVSLLPPDDHAAALLAMREQGREPMSMTHGDFDYDYLQALVLDGNGNVRLRRVSFAAHIDSTMTGRRGFARTADETQLHPARQGFVAMFTRLRREHGVRSFLAHSMTVTPDNVEQVAGVAATAHELGYGLWSFQPAALVGDERRHRPGVDGDAVWAAIERGVGARLPFRALQTGDERCNRTTHGFFVGRDYFPILDDEDPRDLRVRDAFLAHCGGMRFSGTSPVLLAARLARVVAAHPGVAVEFARWTVRMLRRVGLRRLVRHRRIRPVTFVMHSFMDAADVRPAWDALRRSETPDDPRIRATRDRLQACAYAMAHPDTDELVPACVQHSVLDPAENAALARLLPRRTACQGSTRA